MRGSGDASASMPVVLTEDEISRVLAGMTDTQHRAIFRILLDTGLSLGEILGDEELDVRGIHIQDFDVDEMTLKVEARFTKEDLFSTRVVPMSAEVLVAVQDLLYSESKDFRIKRKLFNITNRRVRQLLNEAGERVKLNSELTASLCRRTAIVRMLKQRIPPAEVRRRLGFLRVQEENMILVAAYLVPSLTMQMPYTEEMLAQVEGCSGFSGFRPER